MSYELSTAQDTDWRMPMLKNLFHRLQWIFTAILISIITLILIFTFDRQLDAQQTADASYIQRIASLIVYELKDHPESSSSILKDYEQGMSVYSHLVDSTGNLLYQSNPNLPTSFDTLLSCAKNSIKTTPASKKTISGKLETSQSGYMELSGRHHDRYLMISSQIPVDIKNTYYLTVLIRYAAPLDVFLQHLPVYSIVWVISFFCILLLSHWMLKKAFAPTEQMLESQKNFIASASHELKAPLAVIMSHVELLQSYEEKESPKAVFLSTIDAECTRMSKLIQDLLFLASSDARQQQLLLSDVVVDTLLFSLYEAFEPICLKKKIQLIPDFTSESYPLLHTDSQRLFQLLSIYVDNAISYSPEGGRIELQAIYEKKELLFFVADHGTGIAKEDQPFIFDRFYCADKSRTEKQHFGLGLSIAKELAELLGGKIGFLETEGGGATFYLTLPVS